MLHVMISCSHAEQVYLLKSVQELNSLRDEIYLKKQPEQLSFNNYILQLEFVFLLSDIALFYFEISLDT